jgi:hypothetical protein
MARVRAFASPLGAATNVADSVAPIPETPAAFVAEVVNAPAPAVEPPPVPYPPVAEKVIDVTPEPIPVAVVAKKTAKLEPIKVVAVLTPDDDISQMLREDLHYAVEDIYALGMLPSPTTDKLFKVVQYRLDALRRYYGVAE